MDDEKAKAKELRERVDTLKTFAHLLGQTPPVSETSLAYKTGLSVPRVQAALERLKADGMVKNHPAGGVTWWFPTKRGGAGR